MQADWRDWEFDEIPYWSEKAQYVVLILLNFAFCLAVFIFCITPYENKIDAAKQQELLLQAQFRLKADEVALLPELDAQMVVLEKAYQALKNQLPQKNELAVLLAGINNTGLQYDLNFKGLSWQQGKQFAWLEQVPLKIELEGSYNNIGLFSSALSRLPRILVLEDLTLESIKNKNILSLSIMANTYRFIDLSRNEK